MTYSPWVKLCWDMCCLATGFIILVHLPPAMRVRLGTMDWWPCLFDHHSKVRLAKSLFNKRGAHLKVVLKLYLFRLQPMDEINCLWSLGANLNGSPICCTSQKEIYTKPTRQSLQRLSYSQVDILTLVSLSLTEIVLRSVAVCTGGWLGVSSSSSSNIAGGFWGLCSKAAFCSMTGCFCVPLWLGVPGLTGDAGAWGLEPGVLSIIKKAQVQVRLQRKLLLVSGSWTWWLAPCCSPCVFFDHAILPVTARWWQLWKLLSILPSDGNYGMYISLGLQCPVRPDVGKYKSSLWYVSMIHHWETFTICVALRQILDLLMWGKAKTSLD